MRALIFLFLIILILLILLLLNPSNYVIFVEENGDTRGCDGAYGVVADPEYGTLVEYSKFSDYIP